MSYLTISVYAARLITIAESLHKSTLCRVYCSSCVTFHPGINLIGTTRLAFCICIRIVDAKAQMQMQVQGHWACPNASNGAFFILPLVHILFASPPSTFLVYKSLNFGLCVFEVQLEPLNSYSQTEIYKIEFCGQFMSPQSPIKTPNSSSIETSDHIWQTWVLYKPKESSEADVTTSLKSSNYAFK